MNQHDAGQAAAWLPTIVEQYESPLLRYAARLLGDADRARDVVQDTFLRLCRENPDDLRDRIAPWLYTVCRNRALDLRKKESRMNPLSDQHAAACASGEEDQQAAVERRETTQSVRALLETLPENQQEVIRLKVEHDLSYREISEVTGLSVSNVGYLLHVGLKTVRERFCRGSQAATS